MLDLDEFIVRLITAPQNKCVSIRGDEVIQLCKIAKASFLEQGTLLKLQSPVKICGDIHGQYFDLLRIFGIAGCPSTTTYLFLGDYVDRGKYSLETICLLLALKSRRPDSFFLLRGNHELTPINRTFGFFDEMKRRFQKDNFLRLYLKVNDTFNYMPIAAVIDNCAFCCHGGLSPLLHTPNCVTTIQRPISPNKAGLVADLLWSDPSDDIDEWEKQNQPDKNPRHRGIGYLWGATAHECFLRRSRLKLVVRAHECVDNGYRWSFGKTLATVFSAPNYSNRNYAAVATYNGGGTLTFKKFR